MDWKAYALIAVGSAIGGMARFWLGTQITLAFPASFPWGTFIINLAGSFLIGCATAWSELQTVRLLVMVGLCGGFTTFSSFSLENLNLFRQGDFSRASAYIVLSVAACLAAVSLGFTLAKWLRE